MKRLSILLILTAFATCVAAQTPANNTVEVTYSGTSATVAVADNISQYLTVTQQGAHVSIAQSDSLASEVTYRLSGASTDGEFYMSGSYKATLELNGLTLTNVTPVYSGAAVHIQHGQRTNVKELTRTTGASTIMITHDLGVVASMCDRVNIMYGGKLVETGTDREIYYQPNHPYTMGLLSRVNNPEEEDRPLEPIPGSPPDLLKPPLGCPFVDRCEQAMKVWKLRMPEYENLSPTHLSACWLNEKRRRERGGEHNG